MNDEQLGFDPTIRTYGEPRYFEITRNSQKGRLVIDHLMKRAACIAGRATTCWLTYRGGGRIKKALCRKRFMAISGTGRRRYSAA